MESAWSNGKPAYRCRHGHTSAAPPDPGRVKNAYVREDRILAHLPAQARAPRAERNLPDALVWPQTTLGRRRMLRQVLAIFQRIGAAEAADVSAELGALPGTPGPASTP